jgi:phage shock protein E
VTRSPAFLSFAAALALCVGCATRPTAASSAPIASTASATPGAAAAHVTEEQARALVKDGARLVDVRTPEEFAAGHLEGAINLPVDTLKSRAAAELAPSDAPVVLYCRSGRRSAQAAALLGELGFTQVHDLGPMPTGTPAAAH